MTTMKKVSTSDVKQARFRVQCLSPSFFHFWAVVSLRIAMNLIRSLIFLGAMASPLAAIASSHLEDSFPEIKRSDGSVISYYFHAGPQTSASKVLMVYLQGSDCNSVKHDVFFIANAQKLFPSADLLTVDKLGITASLPFDANPERPDCPAAYIDGDSPSQRVADLNAVMLNVFKDRGYDKIIAVGASEGAVVAAMFAAESNLIHAVVLINGGGRWFLDDVLHNIKISTKKSEVKTELDGFKQFAEHVTEAEPFPLQMSNHGYRWWREVLTIDLQSVIEKISVPVLLIQAGKDESVSPDAVKSMAKALQKINKVNFKMLVYPKLNHGLSTSGGQYRGNEVLVDVSEWLKH